MYQFNRRFAAALWGSAVLGVAACDTSPSTLVNQESGLPPLALNLAPNAVRDASVDADFAQLAEDIEAMLPTLPEMSKSDMPRVTYLGRGAIEQNEDWSGPEALDESSDRSAEEDPDFVSWTSVSLDSGNEFRVELPRTLLERAGRAGGAANLHLGSDIVSEEDLSLENVLPSGETHTLPNVPERLEDGTPIAAGWSNGIDGRRLRGTYNVAQTGTAWRKLVDIGGCSGTMVGPKHIVTAGHCIRNFFSRSWVSSTARAGRNGGAWRDSVSFSTSNTWYWVPSSLLSVADGFSSMPFSATPYDIAVIVTHNRRMGNTVGWMGWWWWSSDSSFGSAFKYNRGYPSCSRSNAPAGCLSNGLYGDSSGCYTGDYSSRDSQGINRRFRFSCDISGGHSGSSLYHYRSDGSLVVTGIVSWEHCYTCGPSDARPNTGVRITRSYSDSIHWLRQTFP